jgi:DMSO/TMAO reductase YedYZ molybdopterin-dependent catalytic subunit
MDPSVVIGVSFAPSRGLVPRAEDLRALQRYTGFSLAELLKSRCEPADCAPDQPGAPTTYVDIQGANGRIVTPLSKLTSDQPQQRLIIADSLNRKPLSNDRLKAFLLENGRVTETVEGSIGLRLIRLQ